MISAREISWDQARENAEAIGSLLERESINLAGSVGRTTAENIVALCDLPTYTTSAMDGYALRGAGPWKIVGDIKAGEPSTNPLLAGEAMRIATGAVIPEGVATVIEWEKANVVKDFVHASPTVGAHIRPAGAECKAGDTLVSAGTTITPGIIGFLSAAGHDEISVRRRPRIALLFLGDELLLTGQPHDGRVRDALGPQLPAWLARMGAEVVVQKYVADELSNVIDAISEVAPLCDVIVTTGGTADGPRDHVHAALTELSATLVVDRIRSRPGHPSLLAQIPFASANLLPLLGLPGNPQSAIVALTTMGWPLLNAMLGKEFHELSVVTTNSELRAPENFSRLVLGNLIDGNFVASEHLGSAMLRGLAQSTGFAVAPSGVSPPGSLVRWLPLP